MVHNLLSVAQ